MDSISPEQLLYGDLTARIRRMLEPVAHDSFLFHDDTMALIQPSLNRGLKILDAGCGRGTYALRLAEAGCNVVAIDSTLDRTAHVQDLLREKNLQDRVAFQLSTLPNDFPEDHFDMILDCFSWWHISDWGRLFNLSRRNIKPQGRLLILDIFFGWNTTLDFRREMLERWQTAFPTLNECRNMLIKREFRLVNADPIQDSYIRYLDSLYTKIEELEKEDLGSYDPGELKKVKSIWEWFRNAAHKEELVATFIVAELTS